jgi:hypothetical protein
LTRSISKTKITEHDLERLDRLIYKKRDMSAKLAKKKLRLEASGQSVKRFLDLDWAKIKIRFLNFFLKKSWFFWFFIL